MGTYEPDSNPDVGVAVILGVSVEIAVDSGTDVVKWFKSVEVDGTELSMEDAG